MIIAARTNFLFGKKQFAQFNGEKNKTLYDVPDREGAVMEHHDWAAEMAPEVLASEEMKDANVVVVTKEQLGKDAPQEPMRAAADNATLEVQDVKLGQSSEA